MAVERGGDQGEREVQVVGSSPLRSSPGRSTGSDGGQRMAAVSGPGRAHREVTHEAPRLEGAGALPWWNSGAVQDRESVVEGKRVGRGGGDGGREKRLLAVRQ